MAYSHSFSAEFYSRGEELDCVKSARPKSIYQALFSMDDDRWEYLCRELFPKMKLGTHKYVEIDSVMDVIVATDTVTDLSTPVEVWIDEDGYWRILVY